MCYMLLATAAITAYSAYTSAQATKAQNEYQAEVAENNAQAAEWQAKDAVQRGNTEADNMRRKGAQTLGSQRAAMSAAGLDVSTGSALSILEDTDYFNRVDQLTIRDNAAREAWGYRVQGSNAQASAGLYRGTADSINPMFEGVKAGVGSYYSNGGYSKKPNSAGGNTLMTSGSSVNPKWYSGSPSAGNMG